ncbi:MAG: hypothetical protein OEL57_08885 [Trichlorobacter sp.]|uniref:hypothetical protein n=1 Tax=Trichlorobacter sp. TaxID=2911007 RepID=UPI0025643392|nr:hypothetical protein [Trichlorobacter sp.]MDK9718009.1 hypothetical protein [Trichlorobacter sp.]
MSLNLAVATLYEIEQARNDCRTMVTRRALVSGAAVLVPLPGGDLLADVGMLMQLLPRINVRFGLSPEQVEELSPKLKIMAFDLTKRLGSRLIGKAVTTSLVTSLVTKMGARVGVKSVARFVPLVGQAAAAAISISMMRYIGNQHVEACYQLACQLVTKRDNTFV